MSVSQLTIEDIKVFPISVPLSRAFWMSREPYRTASEIIVEVSTSAGIKGYGQIHGRPMEDIAKILQDMTQLVKGMDAMAHEAIWNKLFALTYSRQRAQWDDDAGQPHFGQGQRPQIMAAIAGIDIALWDIKGKALGMPVWRLLGGTDTRVFAYASGGYYEEDRSSLAVIDEMRGYVEQGYRAVKMKCGCGDLDVDIARIKGVREAIGADVHLMIDANGAFSFEEAEETIRAFEPYDIFWFEEPLHWYDPVRALGKLAQRTTVPMAAGESEIHRWGCRDLIDMGGVKYMQFDCTRAGGVTEWLKVAAYAAAHGVMMVPHHDPQVHGHLVAAVPNGFGVETFPNPERDPLWQELYTQRPEIRNGILELTDDPGFGFELDWNTVKRYLI